MAPVFSLVAVLDGADAAELSVLAGCLERQSFQDWELVVPVDGVAASARASLEELSRRDGRVRVLDVRVAGWAAANAGIDAARGAFVAFLGQGDLLHEGALALVHQVIEGDTDVDFVYSDETLADPGTGDRNEFRKPDWSPTRLRCQWYTGNLAVMRTDVVRAVGGIKADLVGAEAHDLALRVGEAARTVSHLAEVVYHRARPAATGVAAQQAGVRAVQDHLDRTGVRASVEAAPVDGIFRVRHEPVAGRTVSVIIPTIGASELIWGVRRALVVGAVQSVMDEAALSGYDVEVVVVYDPPTPDRVLDDLRAVAGEHLTLVRFEEPFNFSRKMNVGALHARGDFLVLLNDDVQTREPGWLAALLGPLEEPAVGLTGAKLYFADSRLQHVGHCYAYKGYVHPYARKAADARGPHDLFFVDREVSGVTGACIGVRRSVYFEVGGFAEGLPNNYNDVDLSYKVRRAGLSIVWQAHCELFHFESISRDPVAVQAEAAFMLRRWGVPDRDPYIVDWVPSGTTRPASLAAMSGIG